MPEWRNLVCGAMIIILPTSLPAQDSGRAMLHSEGETRLNGTTAPNSSAIFPHDVIETMKRSAAKIDADGSTVTVLPETVVQFEGDELVLDHGQLQLNTSRQMRVRVNCLTVIPISPDWSRYDVTDVDGKVTVVAYQHDFKIHSQGAALRSARGEKNEDAIVHQGEQSTRDEKCGAAARPSDVVHARGAILNDPIAKGLGIVLVGVGICLGLCHGDDPLSPWKP